jgi:hypothetical protein
MQVMLYLSRLNICAQTLRAKKREENWAKNSFYKKLKASALKVLEFPETVQTLILEIICNYSIGYADT